MVYVLLFEWRSLKGKELKKLIKERDRYEGFWEEMLLEIKNLEYFKKEIDITLLRLLGFGLVNSTAGWYQRKGRFSVDEICDAVWQLLTEGALAESVKNKRKKKEF